MPPKSVTTTYLEITDLRELRPKGVQEIGVGPVRVKIGEPKRITT